VRNSRGHLLRVLLEARGTNGIKLGFPKSEVATINGKTVAVIEGISGKMVDPEEFSFVRDKVGQFPTRNQSR
jgi:hypothetical protein